VTGRPAGRPTRGDKPRVRWQVWTPPETREAVEADQRPGETLGDVVARWAAEVRDARRG